MTPLPDWGARVSAARQNQVLASWLMTEMVPTPSSSSTELVRAPGRGLGFSLFGVPVRIASSFWIIAILFGTQGVGRSASSERAILEALTWTAVVFVSILLHEFGHATAARAFGAEPSITLHALGGLTQFEPRGMSRPQRWLVSFAGPAAGLLFGIAVYVGARWLPAGAQTESTVDTILRVNIGWSLINLLPVLPFDGGQMLSAFLGPRRELWTAIISGIVGTSVAILGYIWLNSLWVAFLFGSAAVTAIRQVRFLWSSKADRDAGLDEELASARAAIAHGEVVEVLKRATRIVDEARTSALKNGGLLAQAWAHASAGRRAEARETIERLERDAPADPYLVAAVEDALGAPDRARAWLEAERRQGVKRIESIKLLIDLYARGGELERAAQVATESVDVLSEQDARAVLAAAVAGGASAEAAGLAAAIERSYAKATSDIGPGRSSAEVPPV
ncbi:MAG TPA: site-2 protease family protein [Polyangiaceae bacterium]|nr:site-2 protease family protein [Polyangiaceae bacterium]